MPSSGSGLGAALVSAASEYMGTKYRVSSGEIQSAVGRLQSQANEIPKQIRELENTEIIGLVRETGMTIEQFADLFQNMKGALPPVQAAEPQEEADDEEI